MPFVAFGMAFLSAFVAGGSETPVPVILISCDTLRADHVGCYGYGRDTTPCLDQFSKDAALFENAYTPESWTLTAHMTMLTGLYPINHDVTANNPLAESIPTLAERLRGLDYRSAGFTGHGWQFLARRGFDRGFECYDIPDGIRSIDQTNPLVRDWLDSLVSERDFFLFFHNYDLHSRWTPPRLYAPQAEGFSIFGLSNGPPARFERAGHSPGFTRFLLAANAGQETPSPEENTYLKDCYDNVVHYIDARLGGFLEELKIRGIYDQSLIIVTADHGEAFGEHKNYLHLDVYEENLHIPLLIKFPKGKHAGAHTAVPVSLADIVPTVLDVLDQPQPEKLDGVSLAAVLDKRVEHPAVLYHQRLNQQSVRCQPFKLILDVQTGAHALYDLSNDPAEHDDCAASHPEQSARLRDLLDDFFTSKRCGWQIDLERTETPWQAELKLAPRAPGRITQVHMLQGDCLGKDNFRREGEAVCLSVDLSQTTPYESITVGTDPPALALSLIVKTKQPFHADSPCTRIDENNWEIPLEIRGKEAAALKSSGITTRPRITVRHQSPDDKSRNEERGLNTEQSESLRALGYLK